MGITPLTAQRFLKYQNQYMRTLNKVPSTAVLRIITTDKTGGFTDFTGDSDRAYTDYTIKCLYKRNFSLNERTKYGLKDNVTGVIRISPIHLKQLIGRERLDKKEVEVIISTDKFGVDEIVYLEPLYNTCIGIEIRLLDEHEF